MMHLIKNIHRELRAIALLLMVLSLMACDSSGPVIPKATKQFSDYVSQNVGQNSSQAQACVEPVAEMRKNHMNYILHQRDKTMRQGIRSREHSLEECINCHVGANVQGPGSEKQYPDISSEEHFCQACHSYVAVKIDCFQCHADTPVRDTLLKGGS